MKPKAHSAIRLAFALGLVLSATAFGDDSPDDLVDANGEAGKTELLSNREPSPDPKPRKPAQQPSEKPKPAPMTPPAPVPPTAQNEAPPVSPPGNPPEAPPQAPPPPQTPPNERPQNIITGIRQGDVIIMKQNQEQIRIWNEQQDSKSLENRLGYEGRHGQQIPIEPPQGYTTPVVMGEVTDAEGNVWERVKVNAKDVPQYLEKNPSGIYVVSVGNQEPRAAEKKLQAGDITKDSQTGKPLPQAITGVTPSPDPKVAAQPSPTSVTTFFKGLSDKMVEEGRAADKARELASTDEEKKDDKQAAVTAPASLSGPSDLAVNNDIAIGGGNGFSDLSATGNLATELFRLKQKGAVPVASGSNASPQVMRASLDGLGNKLGISSSQPMMGKRGIASLENHEIRKTVKNWIAVLAGIVTLFLFREVGVFNKLRLSTPAGSRSWLAAAEWFAQTQKRFSKNSRFWAAAARHKKESEPATSATRVK